MIKYLGIEHVLLFVTLENHVKLITSFTVSYNCFKRNKDITVTEA